MGEPMSVSQERVAAAWAAGREASGSHMDTDGKSVYTYGHEIGITEKGEKIGRCCHASNSSAAHSGLLYAWADKIVECAHHGRPDLHKDRVHRHKHPVLLDLCKIDIVYRTATEAIRANRECACVFQCLFCKRWHVNSTWGVDSRESSSEHRDDTYSDDVVTHRVNPFSLSQEDLYKKFGFEDAAEFDKLTRSRLVYGDDLENLGAFEMWEFLDKTKVGLLAAFPKLLEPQPTERLWSVRSYGKSTHRRARVASCALPEGDRRESRRSAAVYANKGRQDTLLGGAKV
jgi:hypothetical protein